MVEIIKRWDAKHEEGHRKRVEKPPNWTEEEINLLSNLWGSMMLKTIAKKLGRTQCSVVLKAQRLGLGATKLADGKITARLLAKTLGIDVHAVTHCWIPKYGLKCVWKITRSIYKFCLIDLDDFWRCAEKNQDKFDSRRFEAGILGAEPAWMAQKRKADQLLPRRRLQKWTRDEDNSLRAMFKSGHLTYREIGQRLGRSAMAVGHRLGRIDI
ncbi:MAG: hypothetical protein WC364_04800 [Eubacteriales bacterium]|jgi:hypothetical protein